jgi:hypothetical protein
MSQIIQLHRTFKFFSANLRDFSTIFNLQKLLSLWTLDNDNRYLLKKTRKSFEFGVPFSNAWYFAAIVVIVRAVENRIKELCANLVAVRSIVSRLTKRGREPNSEQVSEIRNKLGK